MSVELQTETVALPNLRAFAETISTAFNAASCPKPPFQLIRAVEPNSLTTEGFAIPSIIPRSRFLIV